jgi:hypothetical protein
MTLFYSRMLKGFLDDTLHEVIPKEAVPISTAQHQALLKANSQGAKIVPNDQGWPIAVLPSATQQLREAKAQAHQHLARQARLPLQNQAEGRDESEIFSLLHRYAIAQRFAAGTASPAEITALDAERQARGQGESLGVFCQTLCQQGEYLMLALGRIHGLQYRIRQEIDRAQTLESLEALMAAFPHELHAAQAEGSATREV